MNDLCLLQRPSRDKQMLTNSCWQTQILVSEWHNNMLAKCWRQTELASILASIFLTCVIHTHQHLFVMWRLLSRQGYSMAQPRNSIMEQGWYIGDSTCLPPVWPKLCSPQAPRTYLGWVCYWLSSLLRWFFSSVSKLRGDRFVCCKTVDMFPLLKKTIFIDWFALCCKIQVLALSSI